MSSVDSPKILEPEVLPVGAYYPELFPFVDTIAMVFDGEQGMHAVIRDSGVEFDDPEVVPVVSFLTDEVVGIDPKDTSTFVHLTSRHAGHKIIEKGVRNGYKSHTFHAKIGGELYDFREVYDSRGKRVLFQYATIGKLPSLDRSFRVEEQQPRNYRSLRLLQIAALVSWTVAGVLGVLKYDQVKTDVPVMTNPNEIEVDLMKRVLNDADIDVGVSTFGQGAHIWIRSENCREMSIPIPDLVAISHTKLGRVIRDCSADLQLEIDADDITHPTLEERPMACIRNRLQELDDHIHSDVE